MDKKRDLTQKTVKLLDRTDMVEGGGGGGGSLITPRFLKRLKVSTCPLACN